MLQHLDFTATLLHLDLKFSKPDRLKATSASHSRTQIICHLPYEQNLTASNRITSNTFVPAEMQRSFCSSKQDQFFSCIYQTALSITSFTPANLSYPNELQTSSLVTESSLWQEPRARFELTLSASERFFKLLTATGIINSTILSQVKTLCITEMGFPHLERRLLGARSLMLAAP